MIADIWTGGGVLPALDSLRMSLIVVVSLVVLDDDGLLFLCFCVYRFVRGRVRLGWCSLKGGKRGNWTDVWRWSVSEARDWCQRDAMRASNEGSM